METTEPWKIEYPSRKLRKPLAEETMRLFSIRSGHRQQREGERSKYIPRNNGKRHNQANKLPPNNIHILWRQTRHVRRKRHNITRHRRPHRRKRKRRRRKEYPSPRFRGIGMIQHRIQQIIRVPIQLAIHVVHRRGRDNPKRSTNRLSHGKTQQLAVQLGVLGLRVPRQIRHSDEQRGIGAHDRVELRNNAPCKHGARRRAQGFVDECV